MPSFAQTNKNQSEDEEVSLENVFSAGQGEAVLNVIRRHVFPCEKAHVSRSHFAANATGCSTPSQDHPSD